MRYGRLFLKTTVSDCGLKVVKRVKERPGWYRLTGHVRQLLP